MVRHRGTEHSSDGALSFFPKFCFRPARYGTHPCMWPGPFGASWMLPQACTLHVIAQLPYEVQRRVHGATSTRVMPSACLIIFAGRDVQGHASLELDIPRQSVEIPPHIADLRCCSFAWAQAEDGARRARKTITPHDDGGCGDPEQPVDQVTMNWEGHLPLTALKASKCECESRVLAHCIDG